MQLPGDLRVGPAAGEPAQHVGLVPPYTATRSRMPRMPHPGTPPDAPVPSSATSRQVLADARFRQRSPELGVALDAARGADAAARLVDDLVAAR